jgi:UDP-N-acetylglucosamine--N-acetylmuramyl-(pentapeptide) pyrophosphoryl-undecaprenol N-acetylglucosamine transferase
MGTENGFEARVVPAGGWEFEPVRARPWRRSRPWTLAGAALGAVAGAWKASRLLRRHHAGVVFSTGGYASAPVLLAAVVLRVPIVLHEPNAQPGVVTRIFGPLAARVTVVSDEAGRSFPRSRTEVTGVPVRRSLFTTGREEARKKLGLAGEFTLLVLGGSQGAGAINAALESALPLLAEARGRISIIWSCGRADFGRARAAAASAPVSVTAHSYIDDIGSVLPACDAVVGRAGASATAEMLVAGLPSLLVPYPFAAADHQRRNAEAIGRAGAARVLPESSLTGGLLAREILALAGDPAGLAAMADCARAAAKPGAARTVAGAVLAAMKGGSASC